MSPCSLSRIILLIIYFWFINRSSNSRSTLHGPIHDQQQPEVSDDSLPSCSGWFTFFVGFSHLPLSFYLYHTWYTDQCPDSMACIVIVRYQNIVISSHVYVGTVCIDTFLGQCRKEFAYKLAKWGMKKNFLIILFITFFSRGRSNFYQAGRGMVGLTQWFEGGGGVIM